MDTPPFAVTWDYLCPFARNAHEHLVTALEDGAPWRVTFSPFSLMQSHVEDGEPPVWDLPQRARGVLALEAGVAVRDRFPARFLAVHRALFSARHDAGREISDPVVIRDVLDGAGVPSGDVFDAIDDGWPLQALRAAHEQSVAEHDVFGVPTFVLAGSAVFVRLMTRPEGDAARARTVIENVLSLMISRPELNEFKHTSIAR